MVAALRRCRRKNNAPGLSCSYRFRPAQALRRDADRSDQGNAIADRCLLTLRAGAAQGARQALFRSGEAAAQHHAAGHRSVTLFFCEIAEPNLSIFLAYSKSRENFVSQKGRMKFANSCKEFLGVPRNNPGMTKTKIEHPDLLEIAAMRVRWKEERAAGATGETFARWRFRVRAEVLNELRKVLDDDRRRWPDPRKRDLGKPERRKRRRPF